MQCQSATPWVLGLLLCFPSGCIESNPQPSPENKADITIAPRQDSISDTGWLTTDDAARDSLLPQDVGAGDVSADVETRSDIDTTSEGVVEEEVWDDCHYDCFGGLECKGGEMRVGIWAPIPCWVEHSEDCFYHGESYPCTSGQCGKLELCADDESAIVSLVPEGTTWQDGQVWHTGDVVVGPWDGSPDCLLGSCTWFAKDSEQTVVMQLTVANMPQGALKAVAGTTHMWAAELLPPDVDSLELLGAPVEDATGLTLYFSTIDSLDGSEALLRHGSSGAAVIAHADGTTTTAAWLGGSGALGQQWVIVSNQGD